jgi:hypothetical protein
MNYSIVSFLDWAYTHHPIHTKGGLEDACIFQLEYKNFTLYTLRSR